MYIALYVSVSGFVNNKYHNMLLLICILAHKEYTVIFHLLWLSFLLDYSANIPFDVMEIIMSVHYVLYHTGTAYEKQWFVYNEIPNNV